MDFEKYYEGKIDSEFKNLLEGKSKYNCTLKVNDYSIFVEKYEKYKTRKTRETNAFDSLVKTIKEDKAKRIENQKRFEEGMLKAENARLEAKNRSKKALSKFMRYSLVGLLIAVYIYYIVFASMHGDFIEGFGTAKFVWLMIGAAALIGLVSFFAIKANHKFDRWYNTFYKVPYFTNRGIANFWGTLVLLMLVGSIFIFIATGRYSSKYAFLEFDRKATEIMSSTKYDEDELIELYGEYYKFSEEDKKKLEQNDKFKAFILKYNEAKIANLKESFDKINKDNASETLINAYDDYHALIYDQKNMVTSYIQEKIEYYQDAYDLVLLVKEVDDDILNKYDMFDVVRTKYNVLSDDIKAYVYNSNLIAQFDNKYLVFKNFELKDLANGTVALTVNGDVTFTSLKIPESVDGKTISTITNIKNKTGLKELIVPNTVTKIDPGALAGCSGIKYIELPFVGTSKTATGQYTLFGSIFGTSSYTGSTKARQEYNGIYQDHYIPSGLEEVKITNDIKLGQGAFQNCSMIKTITLNKEITSFGTKAFKDISCTSIYYEGTLSNWFSCDFESATAMPNYGCTNFYINNKIIKVLTVPSDVTTIKAFALNNFKELEELTIPNTVTKIEPGALAGCSKLTKVELPFIGTSTGATGKYTLFGSIFGEDNYTGATSLRQEGKSSYTTFYIPSTLKDVRITGGTKIAYGAFSHTTTLSTVILPNTIQTIEESSFVSSTLTRILYKGTPEEWAKYNVDSKNQTLGKMTIYYFTTNGNRETKSGHWWYIEDGKIVVTTI